MADQYLLPCQCGNKLNVETTQAGQELVCGACGNDLTVPSFSKVKQLEKAAVVAGEQPVKPAVKERSQIQAFAFAAGLMLTVLGVGIAAFCWIYSEQVKRDPPVLQEAELASYNSYVDDSSPLELYNAWNQHLVSDPPGEFTPHFYHSHKVVSDNFRMFAKLAAIVGIVGFLLTAVSFLIPKSVKR